MGIDEGDVRKVLRVGFPPSIEQLVQEFGRAGRDGLPCEGVIFYHESDLQHASFWYKAESSLDHKKAILTDFQESWRYVYYHNNYYCNVVTNCRFVYSDVGGICRRKIILEYFGEDTALTETDHCCDACESTLDMKDAQKQLVAILNAVVEKPGFGEKKVCMSFSVEHIFHVFTLNRLLRLSVRQEDLLFNTGEHEFDKRGSQGF